MSAGLGSVPPAQSILDIGQGNRVNQRLYDTDLPPVYVRDGAIEGGLWDEVLQRAEDAPARVSPGLLTTTIEAAGVSVRSEVADGLAPLLAADREGEIELAPQCAFGCPEGVTVVRAESGELESLVKTLDQDDLLIAFGAGFRSEQPLWSLGLAGSGYGEGNLTSDSTRTGGVVTTTDIAPTILERLGAEVPGEMNGSAIRAEGDKDAAGVADLQERLADRPSRDTVALLPLLVWLLAAGFVARFAGGSAGRGAFVVFGLACAWAPFMLLVAAALDLGELASALLMGLGSVAAALTTSRVVPGYGGLALACGITVGAHAVDVVAGSPYTALSVLGPNPGGGVRFFGIGNELEAILTTLTLVGAGAALTLLDGITPRRAAAGFLVVAAIATLCFAPGRFGADVGAAIVLGSGGATAAVLALGIERRRAVLLVTGGGVLALGALLLIDLALGGAHLSRTVLGAGEAGDLADVLERRIRLMVRTFTSPVYPELLIATAALLAAAYVRRERVLGWFGEAWPARCGALGALSGVLIGTIANDSGSVLLVIGTIYLGAAAAFVWGTGPFRVPSDRCASPSSRPIPGPIPGA